MIDFDFNQKCYGCSCCKNICPKNAITMVYNDNGFLVPSIDKEKCVNCKMCEKICPRFSKVDEKNVKPINCMYIYKKNIDLDLKSSTSSGICFEIAKYYLNIGGLVCGCIWKNMKAEHVITDDIKVVEKMKGTKYVQSDIQYVYKDIKKYLDLGKEIVFFGMACQIMGLKKYLRKDYQNIFFVQIICHSVPSPKIFDIYVKSIEKKYNKKLIDINFRYKGAGGWLTPNTMYYFEDGSSASQTSDAYFVGFGRGLFDRNSCHNCQFKNNFKIADLIVGDAWGIDSKNFIKSKNYGASAIIINSLKGEKTIEKISNDYNIEIVNLEIITNENPAVMQTGIANKKSEQIMKKIIATDEFPSDEILGKKHKLKNTLAVLGILSFAKKVRYIMKHK